MIKSHSFGHGRWGNLSRRKIGPHYMFVIVLANPKYKRHSQYFAKIQKTWENSRLNTLDEHRKKPLELQRRIVMRLVHSFGQGWILDELCMHLVVTNTHWVPSNYLKLVWPYKFMFFVLQSGWNKKFTNNWPLEIFLGWLTCNLAIDNVANM